MLVPFVIDADSLAPDVDWSHAQQIVNYKGLLDIWMKIGILIYDGEDFEVSRIKKAIDNLPQKIRPLWYELLERLPMLATLPNWDGVVRNNAGCLDELDAEAFLAVLDDAKAEVDFNFETGDISKSLATHPSLELCRLLAVPHAQTFASALAASGQHIPAGQTFSELWGLRFYQLAQAKIKQVVIVDRFAVSQHYECTQDKLSGLERFLRLLDKDATGNRYITLFSAWAPELNEKKVKLEDVRSEVDTIFSHLPRHMIKRIKIVMLPNAAFGSLHHDRFVRFGEYVWDIGTGLKVFEGAFAPERSTASFKVGLQVTTYKDAEEALSTHPQATQTESKL